MKSVVSDGHPFGDHFPCVPWRVVPINLVKIMTKKRLLHWIMEKAFDVVAPTSQYAKQMRVTPLSPMAQAIFFVSTISRDIEGPFQDVRIRLAG